jgi:predicted transcriptional regulator
MKRENRGLLVYASLNVQKVSGRFTLCPCD